MDQRISLITLGVDDLDRARIFYAALGFENVAEETGIVAFNLHGSVLGLYPKAELAKDVGLPIAEGFSGQTLGYNVEEKIEVAQIIEKARAAGATILREPFDIFWGGHSAYFADPEGNVWEVSHNPFSKLGPNGEFCWDGY